MGEKYSNFASFFLLKFFCFSFMFTNNFLAFMINKVLCLSP